MRVFLVEVVDVVSAVAALAAVCTAANKLRGPLSVDRAPEKARAAAVGRLASWPLDSVDWVLGVTGTRAANLVARTRPASRFATCFTGSLEFT